MLHQLNVIGSRLSQQGLEFHSIATGDIHLVYGINFIDEYTTNVFPPKSIKRKKNINFYENEIATTDATMYFRNLF